MKNTLRNFATSWLQQLLCPVAIQDICQALIENIRQKKQPLSHTVDLLGLLGHVAHISKNVLHKQIVYE